MSRVGIRGVLARWRARPLRVLYLITNPEHNAVEWQEPLKRLQEIETKYPGRVEFIRRYDVQRADVVPQIRHVEPDIVQVNAQGRQKEGIVLQDESGRAVRVPWNEFARDLLDSPAEGRIFLLAVCYSKGLAEEVARSGAWGVGMNGKLPEEMTADFQNCFYETLLETDSVENACKNATRTLNGEYSKGPDDAGLESVPGRNADVPCLVPPPKRPNPLPLGLGLILAGVVIVMAIAVAGSFLRNDDALPPDHYCIDVTKDLRKLDSDFEKLEWQNEDMDGRWRVVNSRGCIPCNSGDNVTIKRRDESLALASPSVTVTVTVTCPDRWDGGH